MVYRFLTVASSEIHALSLEIRTFCRWVTFYPLEIRTAHGLVASLSLEIRTFCPWVIFFPLEIRTAHGLVTDLSSEISACHGSATVLDPVSFVQAFLALAEEVQMTA